MITRIIYLIMILMTLSCKKDEVIIPDIIRTNSSIEKKLTTKSILIGDSNVSSIRVSRGFSDLGVKIGPNKVGITTKGLSEAVKKTSIDESVKLVFVAIGTNDAYKTNDSKYLMSVIRRTYPSVEDVWVIWGSIGWGSTRSVTKSQVKVFYDKFNSNGFRVIQIDDNYFSNDVDAHKPNGKYHKEIITKMGVVLGK